MPEGMLGNQRRSRGIHRKSLGQRRRIEAAPAFLGAQLRVVQHASRHNDEIERPLGSRGGNHCCNAGLILQREIPGR